MYAPSHKRPFVPSGPSQFCETLAKIPDWVTDPRSTQRLMWNVHTSGFKEAVRKYRNYFVWADNCLVPVQFLVTDIVFQIYHILSVS